MTVDEIQRAVTAHYRLRLEDMYSSWRARPVARPRQVAMYLAREMTRQSYPAIGRQFGNRDHTTVMHAVGHIGELVKSDTKLAGEINHIRSILIPSI